MVLGLPKTKFVRGLVSLDCRLRLLENYFCIIFWQRQLKLSFSGFSNLFNASARLSCTLFFAQSRKILSQFSKLSAILKRQREKLCNDDQSKCENNLGYYIILVIEFCHRYTIISSGLMGHLARMQTLPYQGTQSQKEYFEHLPKIACKMLSFSIPNSPDGENFSLTK